MSGSGKTGYFVMVVWSDTARDYAVGYDYLKMIRHVHNGYVFKEESFTAPKIISLMSKKVTVVDLTKGQQIPLDAIQVPKTVTSLGSIELHRRIR